MIYLVTSAIFETEETDADVPDMMVSREIEANTELEAAARAAEMAHHEHPGAFVASTVRPAN